MYGGLTRKYAIHAIHYSEEFRRKQITPANLDQNIDEIKWTKSVHFSKISSYFSKLSFFLKSANNSPIWENNCAFREKQFLILEKITCFFSLFFPV